MLTIVVLLSIIEPSNFIFEQIHLRTLLFCKLIYLQSSNNNNRFKAAIITFNKYFLVLQNNGTNISCIFPYCSLNEGHWIQKNYMYLLNNRTIGLTLSFSF